MAITYDYGIFEYTLRNDGILVVNIPHNIELGLKQALYDIKFRLNFMPPKKHVILLKNVGGARLTDEARQFYASKEFYNYVEACAVLDTSDRDVLAYSELNDFLPAGSFMMSNDEESLLEWLKTFRHPELDPRDVYEYAKHVDNKILNLEA